MCFVRCAGRLGRLPAGVQRIPGPVLVVAARYAKSPVGPYLELAIAEPVRIGARVTTCAAVMVVDSVESRDAGRNYWGFPKELGSLDWSAEGENMTLRWKEREVVVTGRPVGPAIPSLVPYRSLQSRADGVVRVGGFLRGAGRLGRVDISVGTDDDLTFLAGRHHGMAVTKATVTMGQAHRLSR